MISFAHGDQDKAKFYATYPKIDGVVPVSFEDKVQEQLRRECHKLYGRSKYHPSGRLYTRDERPWLFGE